MRNPQTYQNLLIHLGKVMKKSQGIQFRKQETFLSEFFFPGLESFLIKV